MYLDKIQLQNFRSFRVKSFSFSQESTLMVGDNATGKTNILEAIWLLATGRSFRARVEREMIRNGEELARVSGELVNGEGEELEILLTTGEVAGESVPRKRYIVSGLGKRRMDFVGNFRVVLFRPEDLELLLGGPSIRREYLDSVLEQVDREYRRSLLSYKKGLRQRNKLLERIREGEAERKQLLFWNRLLIKNGEVVESKREAFVEFVNEAFGRERISQVFGGLEIVYDRSVISEKRLRQYKRQEVAAGATLVGPHRDDFKIIAEVRSQKSKVKSGRDLAVFGSRGEQRLAVLALKLAELSFVTQHIGKRPLLLLDDIFSELDHEHREDVLEVVGQQQTILTTTDLHLVEAKYRKKMKVIELQ